MKFLRTIAKECGVSYSLIHSLVRSNDIQTKNYGKLSLDKENEEKLHKILFFGGWVNELTFESKINSM